MFNSNGDIAIPAIYNYLEPVRNGMIIAVTGAHKYRGKKDEHSPTWEGGKNILIDIYNKVLITDIKYEDFYQNINFYSLLIANQPVKTNIRQNFKGVNGKYYSFINFEKEFRYWLKSSLLKNFTKNNLINASYSQITSWTEPKGWIGEKREPFINSNFNLIKSRLLEINNPKCDYGISGNGLNPYEYTLPAYQKYFNNCGESKTWIYPVKDVYITHENKKGASQDHFEFLRTDNGYKLISISIN